MSLFDCVWKPAAPVFLKFGRRPIPLVELEYPPVVADEREIRRRVCRVVCRKACYTLAKPIQKFARAELRLAVAVLGGELWSFAHMCVSCPRTHAPREFFVSADV